MLFILLVVMVGVVSYGYIWWKGFLFSDIMYVMRKSMNNVVVGVGK